MDTFYQSLSQKGFEGEVDYTDETRQFYSHDASLFELVPQVVVFPKNKQDLQRLIASVTECRGEIPNLSLTARSAGTCMSGGAINESIIVDMSRHFNQIEQVTAESAKTQPGVFYRNFEVATLEKGCLLPSYPASRELATVGGMVANNSGGEKSLEYGKTENYVDELEVTLADGNNYTLKPLDQTELAAKREQNNFEGKLYNQMFHLLENNYSKIKQAKPQVTKNSTGYNLWDVWDRQSGVFDLTKLFCGSQGTLGLINDISFSLVHRRPHSGLLILFLRDIDALGDIIPKVLEYKPATFECFDDATLLMSIKFTPYFYKMLGLRKFIHYLISFAPDGLQLLKGVPKMVLMIEFNGETEEEVRNKIHDLHKQLKPLRARYEINGFEEDPTEGKSEKFWTIRRNAFNLLRSKVKDKHTAPFIDDLVVNPQYLTEFLPKLRVIVKKYNFLATIQGHIGDGNFHIIPLMKIEDPGERAKLVPAMKEVNGLVLSYHGSLSGEHNDGLVRGPWLTQMYGPQTVELFKQTKKIFDPANIFNPHKKTDADWDFSMSHIRQHF